MNTNPRDFEKFASECETKMYELHKDCLTRGNPPRIRVSHSNDETYRSGILENGLDTFGLYHRHPKNAITIFDKNIENFAHHSGLNEDLIREVVLIHEIAHSVTHLGLYDNITWEKFWEEENTDLAEHYAQLATWLYLKKYGTPDLVSTFERMSRESQPPRYRSWEGVVTNHKGQVEDVLAHYKEHLLYDSFRDIGRPHLGKQLNE